MEPSRSCPICFESYGEAAVPRLLVACGHTVCEACMAAMLAPLPLRNGGKRMGCPICRKACRVQRGAASALPMNYAILGA